MNKGYGVMSLWVSEKRQQLDSSPLLSLQCWLSLHQVS